MNIKRRVKIQRIKTILTKGLDDFLSAPFKMLDEKKRIRTEEKIQKRMDYNRKMSDEELVRRLLKIILNKAIRLEKPKLRYLWCDKELRFDIREKKHFFINELADYDHKDKYIRYWLSDNKLYQINYTLMGNIEKRLHNEVKRQLDAMGVKNYYEVDEKLDKYWCSSSGYVKTLVIELSAREVA